MKYMMIVKLPLNSETRRRYDNATPSGPEVGIAMKALRERLIATGTLVETGSLVPDATGARIKATGGKLTVTDGPFTESKEVIGGYAIFNAKSKEEAAEIGKQFLQVPMDIMGVTYEVETEIREMAAHQPV